MRWRGCFLSLRGGAIRTRPELTKLLWGSPFLIALRLDRPHRFCNEIRAEGSNSSVLQGETDITRQSSLLAQAWKALTEEERKVSRPLASLSFFPSHGPHPVVRHYGPFRALLVFLAQRFLFFRDKD